MSQGTKDKKRKTGSTVIKRRDFLKSMGASSVGLAALEGEGLVGKLKKAGVIPEEKILGPEGLQARFLINGRQFQTMIEPQTILADVIRDHFHLTGTKIGCNRGACGACTIIMNGRAVNSCLVLAIDAMDMPILTIEGLGDYDKLDPLQTAFIEHDAMQCGFCTSGMIMSCKNLLSRNPAPDDQEIKEAVSGNLCRCATYPNVFKAVHSLVNKDKFKLNQSQ
jgi:xanthine dehydrogenase YagT iron-sulfur-binding subunit